MCKFCFIEASESELRIVVNFEFIFLSMVFQYFNLTIGPFEWKLYDMKRHKREECMCFSFLERNFSPF
jgi:hypothetical protein